MTTETSIIGEVEVKTAAQPIRMAEIQSVHHAGFYLLGCDCTKIARLLSVLFS